MTFSHVHSPAAKAIVWLVVAAMSLPGLSAVACECQDSSVAARCCAQPADRVARGCLCASTGDGYPNDDYSDATGPREGVCRCSQPATPAERATQILSDVRPLVSLTSPAALAVDTSLCCVPSHGATRGKAHGGFTAVSSLDRCVRLCRLTL